MLLSCQRLIMSRHTRLSCAVAAGTVLTGPHTETKTLIVAANGKEYCRVRPLRCYDIFKLQCCCENGTCDSPSLHVFIDAHCYSAHTASHCAACTHFRPRLHAGCQSYDTTPDRAAFNYTSTISAPDFQHAFSESRKEVMSGAPEKVSCAAHHV